MYERAMKHPTLWISLFIGIFFTIVMPEQEFFVDKLEEALQHQRREAIDLALSLSVIIDSVMKEEELVSRLMPILVTTTWKIGHLPMNKAEEVELKANTEKTWRIKEMVNEFLVGRE